MRNKQVKHISQMDFSGIIAPIIAVYKNPMDFPGKIVAKAFETGALTQTIMTRKSLKEMQKELKKTGLVFHKRTPHDHPSLVGIWI